MHSFNLTCVGGKNEWNFLPSKKGDTYTDTVARFALNNLKINFKTHDFQNRGSDERQYSTPNVNMNMVSIMRSKYHDYDEYHTSLDDLNFMTPEFLQQSFNFYESLIEILEQDVRVFSKIKGEPNLNYLLRRVERGGQLHGSLKERLAFSEFMMYADGRTLVEICSKASLDFKTGLNVLKKLREEKLVEVLHLEINN